MKSFAKELTKYRKVATLGGLTFYILLTHIKIDVYMINTWVILSYTRTVTHVYRNI